MTASNNYSNRLINPKERDQLFWLYRLLGLIGAVTFIFFRYLLPADAYDPVWQRIVIAGIFTGGILLSFVAESFVRRNAGLIIQGALYFIAIWALQLLWRNELRTEYLLSYFTILFGSATVFPTRNSLLVYSGFNLIMGILIIVMVPEPDINPTLFLGFLGFILVLINLAFGFLLDSYAKASHSSDVYRSLTHASFQSNPDGILVLSENGKVLDYNDQFVSIWQLKKKDLSSFSSKDLAKEVAKQLWQPKVFRKPGTEAWDWPGERDENGELLKLNLLSGKIVEMNRISLPGDKSEGGFILFFRDLTEALKSKSEKEQSQAIIEATFELSGLGIMVSSDKNEMLFCNETYLKMWNLDEEFVKSEPHTEVISYCNKQLKNQSELNKIVYQLIDHPEMEDSRLLEFKSGKILERSTRKMEIAGEIKGRVWFYRDLTEKIKVDEELIRRNFELDTFVYKASHDLKSPLNSLSGILTLALEEASSDQMKQFLELMGKNVSRLEEFINILTDFSRNERMDIQKEPFRIEDTIREIQGKLRFIAGAGQVEMVVENPDNLELFTDPRRVGIILQNLISNSIKYAEEGDEQSYIRIYLTKVGKDARIIVEDNGTGIPEEFQNKIFDLFFRGTSRSTGSGLGLYVVRSTLRKLAGTIELDRTYKEGARFFIHIPGALTPVAAPQP